MGLDELRVAVHSGPGLVARFKGSILVVTGEGGITEQVEQLVEACRVTSGAADRLRSLGEQPEMPSFCALLDAKDGILVLMSGVITLSAVMTGRRIELQSTEPSAWTEERLKGKPVNITVSSSGMKPTSHPILDLVTGVVLGSAVELAVHRPTETAAPSPTGTPEQAPLAGAASVATAEAVGSPASAEGTVLMPPVKAVPEGESAIAEQAFDAARTMAALPKGAEGGPVCRNGHQNQKGATTCWVCGLSLGAGTTGRAVGRLRGPFGIDVIVRRSIIIGRDAHDAPEVKADVASAVTTPIENQAVSRIHAEIRVDGPNALLIDRNSANGTYVKPPRTSEWIRLEPGHGVMIMPGSGIMVGPLELQFDPAGS